MRVTTRGASVTTRVWITTSGTSVTTSGASAVQKHSLADVLQNKCQACSFILKETPTQVFSYEIYEIFNNTFFTEHLYSDDCFWQ